MLDGGILSLCWYQHRVQSRSLWGTPPEKSSTCAQRPASRRASCSSMVLKWSRSRLVARQPRATDMACAVHCVAGSHRGVTRMPGKCSKTCIGVLAMGALLVGPTVASAARYEGRSGYSGAWLEQKVRHAADLINPATPAGSRCQPGCAILRLPRRGAVPHRLQERLSFRRTCVMVMTPLRSSI